MLIEVLQRGMAPHQSDSNRNATESNLLQGGTTQTKKQVFLTLISPFSLIPNEYSTGLVDISLTMDAFFE
ncbi:MAG: hypothetical protein RJA20_2221 [Bacteroidota bacterium]|jgi:hypothetical protein